VGIKLGRKKYKTFMFLAGALLTVLLILSSGFYSSKTVKGEASASLTYLFDSVTNSYSVTGYTGTPTDLVIPGEYDDGTNGLYPVTRIKNNAFKSCTSLTSITILDGVTVIEEYAFDHCTSATSITIPGSVTTIGKSAFSHCYAATTLTLASGLTSIDTSAFGYCSKLTSIILPEGLVSVGSSSFYACGSATEIILPSTLATISPSAFLGCRKVTSITIPGSVSSIGNGAFANCVTLTEIIVEESNNYYTVQDGILYTKDLKTLIAFPPGMNMPTYTIPSSVTTIMPMSFIGSQWLVTLVVPNSVTSFGAQNFRLCPRLTSVVFEEPNQITTIGHYTFEACKALKEIHIPASVTYLDRRAFGSCENLVHITFAEDSQLTRLGEQSFFNCKKLQELKIPEGVTKIDQNAFEGAALLTSLILDSSTPPTLGSTPFTGSKIELSDGKIYVPVASVAAYQAATGWSTYASKIYRNPLEFVTLELNGGRFINGKSFEHDVANNEITLNNLERAGCTFLGWTGPGYTVPTTTGIVIPADNSDPKIFTAHWDVQTYNVTYELNGGTSHADNPSTYTVEELPKTLYAPTKDAYDFKGWYDNATFSGNVFTAIPEGSSGDIKYYAKWEIKKHTVQFLDHDDSVLKTEIVNHGSPATAPTTNPTRTGHTFAGWNPSTFNSITADTNIYAQYSINQYTMTFNTNGGSSVDAITQNYDTDITPPGNPTKDYYDFAGWYSDSGLTASYTITKMPATDITIYAKWTAKEYSISYDLAGGSVTPSNANPATYTYETLTFNLVNPTKVGYTFKGWSGTGLTSDDNKTVTISQGSSGARSYTANWTINQYTYKFYNGTTLMKEATVDYGSEIVPPTETPSKASTPEFSYTFKEWNPAVPATIGAANETFYAQYTETRRSYSIVWTNYDNAELRTDTVEYGQTPSYGGTPTRPADAQFTYTFTGWSPAVAQVTGPQTYKAQYSGTTNNYTVTIVSSNTDYGTVNKETVTNVPYGTVLNVTNNVVHIYGTDVTAEEKTDTAQYTYTFINWENGTATVTGNLTVTANFTQTTNKYTYTFYKEDESTVVSTATVDYGTGIIVPAGPAKAATQQFTYTFKEWTPAVPATITEDITFTPVYTQTTNQYTATFVDYNGTTVLGTSTVDYGTAATPPANPSRTGYTFTGWDKQYNYITENVTITAEYAINQYSITFDSNGGSPITKITQDYNT
jgi:uncharacterized repeat protein (TIGR02543 family)